MSGEGSRFQAALGEHLQHHQWKPRPTFRKPPGSGGAFPSTLAPLPHQPFLTLLPSAAPVLFGIWQYFLPPGNRLTQTEDPPLAFTGELHITDGQAPQGQRDCPLGWGGMSPQELALTRQYSLFRNPRPLGCQSLSIPGQLSGSSPPPQGGTWAKWGDGDRGGKQVPSCPHHPAPGLSNLT